MDPDPNPMVPDLLIDVSRLIWRRWAGRHPTGIDRVALAYIQHYQIRARAVIQYPHFRRIVPADVSAKLFALLIDGRSNFRRRLILFAARYAHRMLTSAPSHGQYYLNVGHTGLHDRRHVIWVQKTGVKPVYFIHDLIPITHPQFCHEGETEKHVARMTNMLHAAHGVIGNSKDTMSILTEFADSAGLAMPQNIFAHLGTVDMPAGVEMATTATKDTTTATATATATATGGKPYFVILATIEGRKNHALLLNVWQEMIAACLPDIPRLIIIGQRGWRADDIFDRLDHETALKPYVTECSMLHDDDIGRLINGARALLFPSFAEGYGMPLAEALMIGTPVIASNLAVFREIAGDIPEYLDPGDSQGWRDMILRYAAGASPERDGQLKRMEKLTLPSWPDHFAKVDTWLADMRRSADGKLA